jgi:PKD repeat protein
MKAVLILVFTFLLFSFGYSQSYDVLFLGNSYTYSNNLPEVLYQLALSNGDTVNYDSNTPGGYTFELHSTNQTTIEKIKERKWDYVVLQEQSQRPSFPPSQVAVEVYPYAIMLDSMIKASDECTETVFFMTWGRKYGDQVNCQYYPPVCTYSGMQQRLRESYLEMGNMLSATVAPAGMAYKHSMAADSNVNLYMSDNSHPGINGTYLIACVFYATIFQKSPVGLPFISSLNQSTATFLQNIAASTVLDSTSLWNINVNKTKADFQYSVNTNSVQFVNTSVNATEYLWDFGDGKHDTVPDPVHMYSNPGKYIVKLEANSDCYSDMKADTIEIISTGIKVSGLEEKITVFPNPVRENIYIVFADNDIPEAEITISDISGKVLLSKQIKNSEHGNKICIRLAHLKAGCYFININILENYYRKPIMIIR